MTPLLKEAMHKLRGLPEDMQDHVAQALIRQIDEEAVPMSARNAQ